LGEKAFNIPAEAVFFTVLFASLVFFGASFYLLIPLLVFALIGFGLLWLLGTKDELARAILMLPTGFALAALVFFILELFAPAFPFWTIAVVLALSLPAIAFLQKKPFPEKNARLLELAIVCVLLFVSMMVAMNWVAGRSLGSPYPRSASFDLSSNLVQIAFMTRTQTQFLAPNLASGFEGLLMTWNPAGFSLASSTAIMSGTNAVQAKYVFLVFEWVFLTLGVFLLYRRFAGAEHAGVLAAASLVFVALPSVAFWLSKIGAWRLTATFLFVPFALYFLALLFEKSESDSAVLAGVFSSAVLLANVPQIVFLLVPSAFVILAVLLKRCRVSHAAVALGLLALVAAVLFSLVGSDYFGGGGHETDISPLVNFGDAQKGLHLTRIEVTEAYAKVMLGGTFMPLDLWLLLPFFALLALLVWEFFSTRVVDGKIVLALTALSVFAFSLGLLSVLSLYQITARHPFFFVFVLPAFPLLLLLLGREFLPEIDLVKEGKVTREIALAALAVCIIILLLVTRPQAVLEPSQAADYPFPAFVYSLDKVIAPSESNLFLYGFFQGEACFSGLSCPEVSTADLQRKLTNGDYSLNAVVLDPCFAGINKTGLFSFSAAKCIPASKDFLSYDNIVARKDANEQALRPVFDSLKNDFSRTDYDGFIIFRNKNKRAQSG